MPLRLSSLRQCGRPTRGSDLSWSDLPFDFLLPCLSRVQVKPVRPPRRRLEIPIPSEDNDRGEGSSSGIDVTVTSNTVDALPQASLVQKLSMLPDAGADKSSETPMSINGPPVLQSMPGQRLPVLTAKLEHEGSQGSRSISSQYQSLASAFAALMKPSFSHRRDDVMFAHLLDDTTPPDVPDAAGSSLPALHLPSMTWHASPLPPSSVHAPYSAQIRRLRSPLTKRGRRAPLPLMPSKASGRADSDGQPVLSTTDFAASIERLVPLSNATPPSEIPSLRVAREVSRIRSNIYTPRLNLIDDLNFRHSLRKSRPTRPEARTATMRETLSRWASPKGDRRQFGTCSQPRVYRDSPDDIPIPAPPLQRADARRLSLADSSPVSRPAPASSRHREGPSAHARRPPAEAGDSQSSTHKTAPSPSPEPLLLVEQSSPQKGTISIDDASNANQDSVGQNAVSPHSVLPSKPSSRSQRTFALRQSESNYVQRILSRSNPPPVRDIFRELLRRPEHFTDIAGLNLISYARRTGCAGFIPTIEEYMMRRRLVPTTLARRWNTTTASRSRSDSPIQHARLPNLHMIRIHPPFAFLRPNFSHSDLLRHLHHTLLNHTPESPPPPLRTALDEMGRCLVRTMASRSDRQDALLKTLHLYLIYCCSLPDPGDPITSVDPSRPHEPSRPHPLVQTPKASTDKVSAGTAGTIASETAGIPLDGHASRDGRLSQGQMINRCWALIDRFVEHCPDVSPSSRTLHNTIVMLISRKNFPPSPSSSASTPSAAPASSASPALSSASRQPIDLFAITDTFHRRWSTKVQDETAYLITNYFFEHGLREYAKRGWMAWWSAWEWRSTHYSRDHGIRATARADPGRLQSGVLASEPQNLQEPVEAFESESLEPRDGRDRRRQVVAKFAHTGRALARFMRLNGLLVQQGWVEKIAEEERDRDDATRLAARGIEGRDWWVWRDEVDGAVRTGERDGAGGGGGEGGGGS